MREVLGENITSEFNSKDLFKIFAQWFNDPILESHGQELLRYLFTNCEPSRYVYISQIVDYILTKNITVDDGVDTGNDISLLELAARLSEETANKIFSCKRNFTLEDILFSIKMYDLKACINTIPINNLISLKDKISAKLKFTPLTFATYLNKLDWIKYFIESLHCDINLIDGDHRTALSIAREANSTTLEEYLLLQGAKENISCLKYYLGKFDFETAVNFINKEQDFSNTSLFDRVIEFYLQLLTSPETSNMQNLARFKEILAKMAEKKANMTTFATFSNLLQLTNHAHIMEIINLSKPNLLQMSLTSQDSILRLVNLAKPPIIDMILIVNKNFKRQLEQYLLRIFFKINQLASYRLSNFPKLAKQFLLLRDADINDFTDAAYAELESSIAREFVQDQTLKDLKIFMLNLKNFLYIYGKEKSYLPSLIQTPRFLLVRNGSVNEFFEPEIDNNNNTAKLETPPPLLCNESQLQALNLCVQMLADSNNCGVKIHGKQLHFFWQNDSDEFMRYPKFPELVWCLQGQDERSVFSEKQPNYRYPQFRHYENFVYIVTIDGKECPNREIQEQNLNDTTRPEPTKLKDSIEGHIAFTNIEEVINILLTRIIQRKILYSSQSALYFKKDNTTPRVIKGRDKLTLTKNILDGYDIKVCISDALIKINVICDNNNSDKAAFVYHILKDKLYNLSNYISYAKNSQEIILTTSPLNLLKHIQDISVLYADILLIDSIGRRLFLLKKFENSNYDLPPNSP